MKNVPKRAQRQRTSLGTNQKGGGHSRGGAETRIHYYLVKQLTIPNSRTGLQSGCTTWSTRVICRLSLSHDSWSSWLPQAAAKRLCLSSTGANGLRGRGGGGLRHLILGNINVTIIKGHKSTSSMCIALHNEIL